MQTDHSTQIVVQNPLQPLLEGIAEWWQWLIKRDSDSREAARYEGVVSKLPPHLRYDIGELDGMPPVSPPQVRQSYQDELELRWLRGL